MLVKVRADHERFENKLLMMVCDLYEVALSLFLFKILKYHDCRCMPRLPEDFSLVLISMSQIS